MAKLLLWICQVDFDMFSIIWLGNPIKAVINYNNTKCFICMTIKELQYRKSY